MEKITLDNGRVVLVKGDCLDVLPQLDPLGPDGAVLTDPPYGLNFNGEPWDVSRCTEWLALARRLAARVAFTTCHTSLWDYPRPDWVLSWRRTGSISRTTWGAFSKWCPIPVYGKPIKARMRLDEFMTNSRYPSGFPFPCPKPPELFRWLIRGLSEPNAWVLDPFVGSGTTGEACIRTDRRFIGIECGDEQFAFALARIKTAIAARDAQPPLFDVSE